MFVPRERPPSAKLPHENPDDGGEQHDGSFVESAFEPRHLSVVHARRIPPPRARVPLPLPSVVASILAGVTVSVGVAVSVADAESVAVICAPCGSSVFPSADSAVDPPSASPSLVSSRSIDEDPPQSREPFASTSISVLFAPASVVFVVPVVVRVWTAACSVVSAALVARAGIPSPRLGVGVVVDGLRLRLRVPSFEGRGRDPFLLLRVVVRSLSVRRLPGRHRRLSPPQPPPPSPFSRPRPRSPSSGSPRAFRSSLPAARAAGGGDDAPPVEHGGVDAVNHRLSVRVTKPRRFRSRPRSELSAFLCGVVQGSDGALSRGGHEGADGGERGADAPAGLPVLGVMGGPWRGRSSPTLGSDHSG